MPSESRDLEWEENGSDGCLLWKEVEEIEAASEDENSDGVALAGCCAELMLIADAANEVEVEKEEEEEVVVEVVVVVEVEGKEAEVEGDEDESDEDKEDKEDEVIAVKFFESCSFGGEMEEELIILTPTLCESFSAAAVGLKSMESSLPRISHFRYLAK